MFYGGKGGAAATEEVIQLEQEIGLLSTLHHENIVQYLGTERNNITSVRPPVPQPEALRPCTPNSCAASACIDHITSAPQAPTHSGSPRHSCNQ